MGIVKNVVISHGGYASETLFRNWIRYHSYDDWGTLNVNSNGIKFMGKKGYLEIPNSDIKSVSIVRKKKLHYFLYTTFWLIFAFLLLSLYALYNLYTLHKRMLILNSPIIIIPIVIMCFVLTLSYFFSTWVKIIFEQNGEEKTLYFSVSWRVGAFSSIWMFEGDDLLSWRDNKRIVNILKNSSSRPNIRQ